MSNNTQWGNLRSDDVDGLNNILRWLKKLDTAIDAGFQGNGGWTDSGTAVKLTTITDKVGIGTESPTHKLEITGDDSNILKLSGTVNTGKTAGIEVNADIFGLGIYEGVGILYSDGTALSTAVVSDNSGFPGVSLVAVDGVTSSSIVDVKRGQVSINNNVDGGNVDVRFRVNDPDGVRIAGKDSGSTNNALTIYDGDASAFGGTALFAVRNDGAIFTGASQGASGSFTAQSGETITVTNGIITSIV